MSHLQTSGLKILRVWGFNDVNNIPSSGTVWYQSLSGTTPTINTGANGLQRLDYVVKSAEAHGIKLIINFVNNWDDYGGIKAYTNCESRWRQDMLMILLFNGTKALSTMRHKHTIVFPASKVHRVLIQILFRLWRLTHDLVH